jgi:zinc transporter ZupT
MIVFPHKVIKGDGAVLEFQKIILQALFALLEMCGFVSGFVIIKGAFSSNQEWFAVVLKLLFGFAAFVIAAALHVVMAEIENIRDKNYLLSISALVAALVSIAIALYSRSKGGC